MPKNNFIESLEEFFERELSEEEFFDLFVKFPAASRKENQRWIEEVKRSARAEFIKYQQSRLQSKNPK